MSSTLGGSEDGVNGKRGSQLNMWLNHLSKGPAANANKILFKLAAVRHFGQLHGEADYDNNAQRTERALVVPEDEDSDEIWGPMKLSAINRVSGVDLYNLLYKFWSIYLEDLSDIELKITIGSRLWKKNGEVMSCLQSHKTGSRLNHFAKMEIDVDINRTGRIHRKSRAYFGEILFYFQHTQQDSLQQRRVTQLLALVKVYKTELTQNGLAFFRENASTVHCVVRSEDIDCL
ncbi:hypothetical protein EC973_003130 [Apophysomyces ossiformis]|uniref:Uncharacterized protein n=1 Tax=Apophysomyces ossiformis TaxID=679940 RepID=A0A8H7ELA3_9FUNG|nr:hypothetical protein EC973_003130 [Apophysomyces ossiformis]